MCVGCSCSPRFSFVRISIQSLASSGSRASPDSKPVFGTSRDANWLRIVWGNSSRLTESFICGRLGIVLQNKQGLSKSRQVPEGDARLMTERIAAVTVDGAEDRLRMISVHKGTRSIIDGLSRQSRVVGVHNAVDKPDEHPLRHEVCLSCTATHSKSAIVLWSLSLWSGKCLFSV